MFRLNCSPKTKLYLLSLLTVVSAIFPAILHGQSEQSQNIIFDDKMLLDGYSSKFEQESQETLLEMIKDDTLTSYKSAAAIRVFKNRFSQELFGKEKSTAEKILLRRLAHTDSSLVEIEVMHALCLIDRYKYFSTMVPDLIQKLDHYNPAVNEIAYNGLKYLIDTGNNRPREARIVFNTLRKMLFLTRKRLKNVTEPAVNLKQKLDLLRWSIKVLGTQELKNLPSEVLNLL